MVLSMPIYTKNYWDRLKDLEIYSLERRRERFIILCIYKFIIGLISIECFNVYVERGIKVQRKLKQSAKDPIKRLRQNSFYYRGPQIYNLLPECLRQVEEITTPTKHHVEIFKRRQHENLEGIPDQPTTPGLHRVATTNSLVHQIATRERQRRN